MVAAFQKVHAAYEMATEEARNTEHWEVGITRT
jgi:hypothetical protein